MPLLSVRDKITLLQTPVTSTPLAGAQTQDICDTHSDTWKRRKR